ncbi:MAG TPA: sugar transferase [Solirubrobacteraceae bacterium]|nr:sugar transferase [Solirubrobacteraceae bacterium]
MQLEPPSAGPGGRERLVQALDDHTRRLLVRPRRAHRDRLVPRSLAAADLAGLVLAYCLATLIAGGDGAFGTRRELLVFVLTLPCWLIAAQLHGLYGRDQARTDHSTTADVAAIFHIVTSGVLLLLIVFRLAGHANPSVYALVTFWALALIILPMTRMIAREACKRSTAYTQNAIIVGAGDVGQLVGRKLLRHPEYGVNVVGFVDREPRARRSDLPEHLTILGPPERLGELIRLLDVERVVIAFSHASMAELLALVRRLRTVGVQIDLVPRLFELVGPGANLYGVEGIPLLGLPPTRPGRSAQALKRVIDVTGAATALVVLAPLLAFIAVRIRLDSPGPILFRQTRLGRDMREFTLLKFRTMKVATDPAVHRAYIRSTMTAAAEADGSGLYKLDRSDAVTECGRWLRRTSLDELPQLINVLRGDMSLVGPRPCIPYEVENFQPHHLERFLMPQGLTGLWQVTARANSTYGESLDMDVAYVRGWSLGLDLQLLLRTPWQLLHQRSSTA